LWRRKVLVEPAEEGLGVVEDLRRGRLCGRVRGVFSLVAAIEQLRKAIPKRLRHVVMGQALVEGRSGRSGVL
jgi:predicted methyltransferase MtxX (methanogen marker protein 4)